MSLHSLSQLPFRVFPFDLFSFLDLANRLVIGASGQLVSGASCGGKGECWEVMIAIGMRKGAGRNVQKQPSGNSL